MYKESIDGVDSNGLLYHTDEEDEGIPIVSEQRDKRTAFERDALMSFFSVQNRESRTTLFLDNRIERLDLTIY